MFSKHCLSFWSWWKLKAFRVFESNPVLSEINWDLGSSLIVDLWIWQYQAGVCFRSVIQSAVLDQMVQKE